MSLPAEDFERLGELATLLGLSRAALMRDLIESARPVWTVLLDAARTTAAAPGAQRAAMARLAEQMGSQIGEAQDAFAVLTAHLNPGDDGHGNFNPAHDGDDAGPPASNTGVRTL